jgi:hypothetical protein
MRSTRVTNLAKRTRLSTPLSCGVYFTRFATIFPTGNVEQREARRPNFWKQAFRLNEESPTQRAASVEHLVGSIAIALCWTVAIVIIMMVIWKCLFSMRQL